MRLKLYLTILSIIFPIIATIPFVRAYGDSGQPASIIAVYTPESGRLSVSGTYSWDDCKQDNTKKIVGFAIFIDDGQDSDTVPGDPRTTNAEALDGSGMHLANDGQPCKTKSGTFSDETHDASSNPILSHVPDKVCIVIYNVDIKVRTGKHSQIGSGPNYNEDNSFNENHKKYADQSCSVLQISDEIRVGVMGDMHVTSPISQLRKAFFDSVLEDQPSQNLDFGVFPGDVIDSNLGVWTAEMKEYETNFLNKTTVPWFSTYGDHGQEFGKFREVNEVPAAMNGGTFNEDRKGIYFEQTLPYFWSMTRNGIHFVFLASLYADEPMLIWLKGDLQNNKAFTTVIFNHFPMQPNQQGVNDKTRTVLFDLFDQNPQVIAVISSHPHQGFQPVLLTNNAYQFWAWPPGKTRDQYLQAPAYLIYSIKSDGLRIYERDAVNHATNLFYTLKTSTTMTEDNDGNKIGLSLPYMVRDNAIISFPFAKLDDAAVNIYGLDSEQTTNPTTGKWIPYDATYGTPVVTNTGFVPKQLGNLSYQAQHLKSNGTYSAPARVAYIDIFKNQDLSNVKALNYGIFTTIESFDSKNQTNAYSQQLGLELLNNTDTGSQIPIVIANPSRFRNVDFFYQFRYSINDGFAQGWVGNTQLKYHTYNPEWFKDVTLRLWLAVAQSTSQAPSFDVATWAHKEPFMFATFANDGSYSSQDVRVGLKEKEFHVSGEIKQGDLVSFELPSIVSQDMHVYVPDGSRITIVEVTGTTSPLLMHTNPKEVTITDTGGISFGADLFAQSANFNDTLVYNMTKGSPTKVLHVQ